MRRWRSRRRPSSCVPAATSLTDCAWSAVSRKQRSQATTLMTAVVQFPLRRRRHRRRSRRTSRVLRMGRPGPLAAGAAAAPRVSQAGATRTQRLSAYGGTPRVTDRAPLLAPHRCTAQMLRMQELDASNPGSGQASDPSADGNASNAQRAQSTPKSGRGMPSPSLGLVSRSPASSLKQPASEGTPGSGVSRTPRSAHFADPPTSGGTDSQGRAATGWSASQRKSR